MKRLTRCVDDWMVPHCLFLLSPCERPNGGLRCVRWTTRDGACSSIGDDLAMTPTAMSPSMAFERPVCRHRERVLLPYHSAQAERRERATHPARRSSSRAARRRCGVRGWQLRTRVQLPSNVKSFPFDQPDRNIRSSAVQDGWMCHHVAKFRLPGHTVHECARSSD